MPVTLKIPNYTSINVKEQTRLSADLPASSVTLTLRNNNNIVANDYIMIGALGSEVGEITQVQSASGATLVTTVATTLAHLTGDLITALIGNKIRIYRAPNVTSLVPDDSTFALIATISLDPDQLMTSYIDGAGSSSYWYKFTYYNTTNTIETSIGDVTAFRGGGVGQYCSIDSIRQAAGFKNNRNISDDYIDEKRRAAQDTINGSLRGIFTVPFTAPINPMIENITRVMAVGLLQIDQFGVYATNDSNNGTTKVKWATDELDKIKSGQYELTNTDGSNKETPNNGVGFTGWPNGTTASLNPEELGAGDFMFTRSSIDGYQGRHY